MNPFTLKRRHCLKALGGAFSLTLLGSVAAQKSKVLVVFFTWSGSTQSVANEIHRLLGGDIARLETVQAYPQVYEQMTKVAVNERQRNARPSIKSSIPDLKNYDVICIGHPIWGGKMPMALYTFLESAALEGKTVVHFNTHGGSGQGDSQREIERLLPQSQVLPGLAVYGWGGVRDFTSISPWLKRIHLL